jgi:hypothetical protein
MPIRLTILAALAVFAATCPRSDPMSAEPTSNEPAEASEPPTSDEPEELPPTSDEPEELPPFVDEPEPEPEAGRFEPTFGDRVTREAEYRISPVAGGKRLQAVTLVFDDGETWIRAYRPLRSELRFADKRVVVVGRPYWPAQDVQAVMNTHFELESIELAPGETAWEPEPTLVPPPPFAYDSAAALARSGRYAQCRGRVTEGAFEFADGSTLPMAPIGGFFEVEAIEGDQTLLAWVDDEGTLHPRGACPGEVARCGLTDDNMRD